MSRSKKMHMYHDGGYSEGGEFWIHDAIKHPGSLHRSLHVPKGKKIPMSKLNKATHSRDALTRKRANLARTLRNFHHQDH